MQHQIPELNAILPEFNSFPILEPVKEELLMGV
jgi:hypothetical protein